MADSPGTPGTPVTPDTPRTPPPHAHAHPHSHSHSHTHSYTHTFTLPSTSTPPTTLPSSTSASTSAPSSSNLRRHADTSPPRAHGALSDSGDSLASWPGFESEGVLHSAGASALPFRSAAGARDGRQVDDKHARTEPISLSGALEQVSNHLSPVPSADEASLSTTPLDGSGGTSTLSPSRSPLREEGRASPGALLCYAELQRTAGTTVACPVYFQYEGEQLPEAVSLAAQADSGTLVVQAEVDEGGATVTRLAKLEEGGSVSVPVRVDARMASIEDSDFPTLSGLTPLVLTLDESTLRQRLNQQLQVATIPQQPRYPGGLHARPQPGVDSVIKIDSTLSEFMTRNERIRTLLYDDNWMTLSGGDGSGSGSGFGADGESLLNMEAEEMVVSIQEPKPDSDASDDVGERLILQAFTGGSLIEDVARIEPISSADIATTDQEPASPTMSIASSESFGAAIPSVSMPGDMSPSLLDMVQMIEREEHEQDNTTPAPSSEAAAAVETVMALSKDFAGPRGVLSPLATGSRAGPVRALPLPSTSNNDSPTSQPTSGSSHQHTYSSPEAIPLTPPHRGSARALSTGRRSRGRTPSPPVKLFRSPRVTSTAPDPLARPSGGLPRSTSEPVTMHQGSAAEDAQPVRPSHALRSPGGSSSNGSLDKADLFLPRSAFGTPRSGSTSARRATYHHALAAHAVMNVFVQDPFHNHPSRAKTASPKREDDDAPSTMQPRSRTRHPSPAALGTMRRVQSAGTTHLPMASTPSLTFNAPPWTMGMSPSHRLLLRDHVHTFAATLGQMTADAVERARLQIEAMAAHQLQSFGEDLARQLIFSEQQQQAVAFADDDSASEPELMRPLPQTRLRQGEDDKSAFSPA